MSRPLPEIDVRKSLYDSEGYRHTLVQATPVQILTLLEGQYWLWDRVSGRCLVEALADMRLSNHRPEREDVRARRQPVAETRAFQLAQQAVQAAARSSSLSLAAPVPAAAAGAVALGAAASAETPAPALSSMDRSFRDLAADLESLPLDDAPLPPTLGAALAIGLLGLALLWPDKPARR